SPYTVPATNPYVGGSGADEVWSYGLRNPWRFSFDRLSGDLFIADVGESNYEEVDQSPLSNGLGRGAFYGWDCREGFHAYPGNAFCPGVTGYTNPIFEYSHAGGGCAITGGYVARDPSLGDLYGRYVYADLCLGQIRSFIPGLPVVSSDRSEGITLSKPVSFGEDSCGRLYVAEQAANVYRLTGSGGLTCNVLRISVLGRGRGTVVGPGISCPPDCTQVFPQPQTVVLGKHPGKHSSFSGWHRACSGHRGCSVAMTADRNVVAKFSGRLRTHVVMAAFHSVVPDGARALLRAKARPCKGRRHDKAELFKGRKRIASKRLNHRCVAHFRARIRHRSRFKVKVPADKRHRAGRTGWVTVVPRG
nr:PQQ-dependent sugar dehydrogenase [Chloroflexota bacterium]